MEALRKSFGSLGYSNVQTFIQSGNVLFDSDESSELLKQEIESRLHADFGFEVPAIVRPLPHVEALVARNPFANVEKHDDIRLCVTFASQSLVGRVEERFPTPKGDVQLVEVTGSEMLTVMRLIDGKLSNYSTTALEKKLGIQMTSRFFSMLEKLVQFSAKS